MSNHTEVAIAALRQRAREILEERRDIRRRLLEDSVRDRQIEDDLQGCVGGIRALGGEIGPLEGYPSALTSNIHPNHASHVHFIEGRDAIAESAPGLAEQYGLTDGDGQDDAAVPAAASELLAASAPDGGIAKRPDRKSHKQPPYPLPDKAALPSTIKKPWS